MNYSRESIIEKFHRNERLKFVFFWGHTPSYDGNITKACFSQWFGCRFSENGIVYNTAEQYMMSQKALLFGDTKVHEEIMLAEHPKQFKALGRKISGFDEAVWNEHKCGIVVKGNLAKFSQNPALKSFLLNTKERILVEASPYDKIWGIGMTADDPKCENPEMWNGENLLGFCLMEVRDMLR